MAFIRFTLIAAFFLFFGLEGNAQLKPIYFNGDRLISDSTKATSYGIYGKLSNEDLWVIKKYDLYDNLLISGSYKDDGFSIPHGEFIYYDDVNKFNQANETTFVLKGRTRFIAGRGRFENGLQVGRWITFFPNDKIKTITTFVKGVRHGPFFQYNRKGKIEISGNYKLDEKDGDWVYNDGRKNELYQNTW